MYSQRLYPYCRLYRSFTAPTTIWFGQNNWVLSSRLIQFLTSFVGCVEFFGHVSNVFMFWSYKSCPSHDPPLLTVSAYYCFLFFSMMIFMHQSPARVSFPVLWSFWCFVIDFLHVWALFFLCNWLCVILLAKILQASFAFRLWCFPIYTDAKSIANE